ncbi:MAG: hypothetical protein ACTHQM_06130 [Thermoanaerobaculia bacterium]
MRKWVVLLLLLTLSVSAATPKKAKQPVTNAPDAVPHSIALFLGSMSNQGGRSVTFKATAIGTRFFYEEPGKGVTVYRFVNGSYVKEEYLRNATLDRAVKRYAKK